MHITIPSFNKVIDAGGSHEVYHIHVNGVYHSAVRYSRVYSLYRALQHQLSTAIIASLPPFPSKRLLRNLSMEQINERRVGLQKFLQAVAQHSSAGHSATVLSFFINAQIEHFGSAMPSCSLPVYLCSGEGAGTVEAPIGQSTSAVIADICHQLEIGEPYWQYFALFIVRGKLGSRALSYVKWLQDYESPWIALQLANDPSKGPSYRGRESDHSMDDDITVELPSSSNAQSDDDTVCSVVLQKCCWDISVEQRLLTDAGAVGVMYPQAVWHINSGLMSVNTDVLQRLRVLQQKRSFKSYVQLAQSQPGYGYLHLDTCISDYPNPNTRVHLKVGQRTIVIVYTDRHTEKRIEIIMAYVHGMKKAERVQSVFRATRIRVWRIVSKADDGGMQFQFEYLLARDHFEWITLNTEQSALLSQCLQSMGAEIMSDQADSASKSVLPNNLTSGSASSYAYNHNNINTSPTLRASANSSNHNNNISQTTSPSSSSSTTTTSVITNGHSTTGPTTNGSSSATTNGFNHNPIVAKNSSITALGTTSNSTTTTSGYESFSEVFSRKTSRKSAAVTSNSGAFDGITDDDL